MVKPMTVQPKPFRELSPKLLVTIADGLQTRTSLNNFVRILRSCFEYISWYKESEYDYYHMEEKQLLDELINYFHLKAEMQLPFPFGPTNEMNPIKCYVRDIGIYDESVSTIRGVLSVGMQIYEFFKRFDHCEEPLSRYFNQICNISDVDRKTLSAYKVILDPLTKRIPVIIFCTNPNQWDCTALKYFVENTENTQTLIITTYCEPNGTPYSAIRNFRHFLETSFPIHSLKCSLIIWCLELDQYGEIRNLYDLPYLKY